MIKISLFADREREAKLNFLMVQKKLVRMSDFERNIGRKARKE
jgi:hypothetical protein